LDGLLLSDSISVVTSWLTFLLVLLSAQPFDQGIGVCVKLNKWLFFLLLFLNTNLRDSLMKTHAITQFQTMAIEPGAKRVDRLIHLVRQVLGS
jgi:hypothetical protein